VRRNWRMVFNPKYGSYGMIVLPTELFVLVASPILGAAILILLGYALFLVSPLLLLACVLGVGAAVFVKRAMVLAIVEVQIVGLVAAFQTLFGSTKAPVWKRFR
jgi:hypothetical protein